MSTSMLMTSSRVMALTCGPYNFSVRLTSPSALAHRVRSSHHVECIPSFVCCCNLPIHCGVFHSFLSAVMLLNGASSRNVFWCAASYIALGPGSSSVGTFIAHDYAALTNAAVSGAVLAMTGGATLTVSAVRLPSSGALALSGPAYSTPVNMLSASSFAVLSATAITNTVIQGRCRTFAAKIQLFHCFPFVGPNNSRR